MIRRLSRLFGKRYAKGGVVSPFAYARAVKLHGAEGVFVQDGRLIYWKELDIE